MEDGDPSDTVSHLEDYRAQQEAEREPIEAMTGGAGAVDPNACCDDDQADAEGGIGCHTRCECERLVR